MCLDVSFLLRSCDFCLPDLGKVDAILKAVDRT